MARTTSVATLDNIRTVVQQIVQHFHPQKIILFGSYAYGTPSVDSDVDLLVIMDIQQPAAHVAGLISAAVDHPFPLDILVIAARDWEEYLKEKAIFATQVATKGIVLYEARNA